MCGVDSAAGSGSFVCFARLSAVSIWKTPDHRERLVAGRFLSRARPEALRHDVVDLCLGGIDRSDWVAGVSSLYSRAGGGPAGSLAYLSPTGAAKFRCCRQQFGFFFRRIKLPKRPKRGSPTMFVFAAIFFVSRSEILIFLNRAGAQKKEEPTPTP